MSTQATLKTMQDKVNGLDNNRVANFSYTDNAFNNDDVNGTEGFNVSAENNIPTKGNTDLNDTILNKGMRAQTASITRGMLNHFFGRLSYNLNKWIQIGKSLLQHIAKASAHNCFEYDANAKYLQDDLCYIVQTVNSQKVMTTYRRKMSNPEELQGTSPVVSSDQWETVSPSDVPILISDFNDALSRKAPKDSPVFTGVPIVPEKTSTATTDGTLIATEAQVKKASDSPVSTARINSKAVTTDKIADEAVTTAQIAAKTVTVDKTQDITTDTTSAKAIFSATAITFAAFLQTVWRGITWLTAKLNASSGHKHTGGTDDAPRIDYTELNFPIGKLMVQLPSEPSPSGLYPGTWEKWNSRPTIYGLVSTNPSYSAYSSSGAVNAGDNRLVTLADGDQVIYTAKQALNPCGDFNPVYWNLLAGMIFVARNNLPGHSWSTDLSIGSTVIYNGSTHRVVAIHCLAGKFLSVAGGNRPPFETGGVHGDVQRAITGSLTPPSGNTWGLLGTALNSKGALYAVGGGAGATVGNNNATYFIYFDSSLVVPTGNENSPRTMSVVYWRRVS